MCVYKYIYICTSIYKRENNILKYFVMTLHFMKFHNVFVITIICDVDFC